MRSCGFSLLCRLVLLITIGAAAIAQLRPLPPPSLPCSEPASGNVSEWGSQFRFNSCHTGYNPYETILSPDNVDALKLHWTYQTGGYVWSSPAVANGMVYFASYDGNLYALNASTGALIWKQAVGAWFPSPAVADGVVYVGSWEYPNNFNVYALDASTGAFLWKFPYGGGDSSPVVDNGVVYIGSSDTNLYALNARTGTLLWKYATTAPIYSTPAVASETVYVGSHDGTLYALNARTGAFIWKYVATQDPESFASSPAIGKGVVYYVPDKTLYALDSTTGIPLWSYVTGRTEFLSSPAIADGVVYVASWDGVLFAVNAKTGALLWQHETPNPSSPTVANGVVYFGSGPSAYMNAVNASTGALLWRYAVDGSDAFIYCAPTVADGIVYIGSESARLYALDSAGAPTSKPR